MNEQIMAWLEKRDAERVAARLQIKFTQVDKKEADKILNSGDFGDVFASADLGGSVAADGLKDAFTENISISGLKLVGDLRLIGGKPLNEGVFLLVEISVPDAPMPVRALANVIWCAPDGDQFHAGLFFVGINKQDVMKVARFLILQRKAKHS